MSSITIPYNFTPYNYQIPLYNCVPDGYSRAFAIMHRRAGKDKVFMNILARECVKRVGTYFYILPYYKQARLIIWEGVDNDGFRFRDHIPPQIVKRKENQQMVLELVNGSIVRFLGSDNIDSIVGTNPVGVLFSEYPLHKPQAWNYLRPILAQNGGWALFNGTPRGKNHAYRLFKLAERDEKWFTTKLDVDVTKKPDGTPVVTPQAIQDEVAAGMPPELVQQEFYCSFDAGMTGSYYTEQFKLIDQSDPPQITRVPYDPQLPVGCSWDLGLNEFTAIWFYQIFRKEIRLLRYHQSNNQGIPYYCKLVKDTGWNVTEHLMPFDVNVKEYSNNRKRIDTFRKHGLKGIRVVPKLSKQEGRNAVRQILPRCYFDSVKCADGIECLRNHHREYDEKTNTFRDTPAKSEWIHGADSFRVLAVGVRDERTAEEKRTLDTLIALGTHDDPLARYHRPESVIFTNRFSDRYSNPDNYDPFYRRAV